MLPNSKQKFKPWDDDPTELDELLGITNKTEASKIEKSAKSLDKSRSQLVADLDALIGKQIKTSDQMGVQQEPATDIDQWFKEILGGHEDKPAI